MSIELLGTTFRTSPWFWWFVAGFTLRNLLETLLVRQRAGGEAGARTGAASLTIFVLSYFVCGIGTGVALLVSRPSPMGYSAGLGIFLALHLVRSRILGHHLGKGWNPFTTPRTDSDLVTSGPYRWLRHPLYALHLAELGCLWLICPNLVAALAWAADLAATLARIPGEERLLAERYGERWRTYAAKTRRLVPWIW